MGIKRENFEVRVKEMESKKKHFESRVGELKAKERQLKV